ncbi:MAG: response regulator [Candidatus Didemnitutus sp.]|nr:response regulator [Candidatus Didemnitutus sp.]
MPRNRVMPWLCSLVAGMAGLGINQFGLPIFGGTELIFGGWLPLLVTYAFGGLPGTLAAVIAFGLTPLSWGHPWGLLCFGLEPLFVGWLTPLLRGRLRASAAYWLCVGIPLVAVGIFALSDFPFPSNWAIVLKYPANSLLMIMLAVPVYHSPWGRRWLGTISNEPALPLQRVLFQRFGVIVALSIAVLAIVVGRDFDQTLRRVAEAALTRDAKEAARDIANDLGAHQRALALAVRQTGANAAPEEIAQRLETVRREFGGFLTLLAADAHGEIIAAAPATSATGEPIANRGVFIADRAYFREPMASGRPFMSEVFQGRGFGGDLIVAVSEPVLDARGQPTLLLEGSLKLNALLDIKPPPGYLRGRSLLLLDRTGRAVAGNGVLVHPALTDLTGDPVVQAGQRAGEAAYTVDLASAAHGRERYVVAHAIVPGCGWQVYLTEPIWSTQRLIAAYYLATFVAAGIAVGLALVLARITAADVTGPLNRLVTSIQALARQETAAPFPLEISSASRELAELGLAAHEAALLLSRANRELAISLHEQSKTHQQLRQVLLHLDDKVRQRTEQLEEARQQAESANRAKSEFIASTSHELRTPLNVILGMSEVLLERTLGELNPRQHESVAAIEESGRHLLALINDILDLSKIEAGKLELDIQETDVRGTCEASLRFVRNAAQRKQHTLEFACPADLPPIAADSRRLKQILVNLLSNAVKFTPDGGRVRFEVVPHTAPAEVHFRVSDTGIGITPEQQARLFQPFQQIDGALNRRHGGTGLGLVLARRMAELHGGRITLESAAGQGSCFSVILPMRAAERPAPRAPALASSPAYAAPAGTHVLIAEDNDTNVLIYQRSPIFAACRFTLARNGEEAIAAALADRPDLILMDVQMPGMDGLTATRRLRADPRTADIPIITVTALAMLEDRTRCLEAGATSYLSKPVNLRELARHVAEALIRPVKP